MLQQITALPPPSVGRPDGVVGLHQLMERYVDGDDVAFTELHRRLTSKVRARLGKMIHNHALVDDLVQQTFMRAHQARQRFEAVAQQRDRAVEAWYLAIARNVALDHLRHEYRRDGRHQTLAARGELEGMGVPDAAPNPESLELDSEQQAETIQKVRAAIAQLPPNQRDVVRMHKLGGLSMSEISDSLGVRPGALRVRAHRAYKALSRMLLGPEEVPAS